MNSQADVRTFTQSAGLFPPVSNHSGEFPEFSQMIQILFNQLENIEKQFKSGTAASGQLYGSLMMMMSEFSEHRSSINPERSDARRLLHKSGTFRRPPAGQFTKRSDHKIRFISYRCRIKGAYREIQCSDRKSDKGYCSKSGIFSDRRRRGRNRCPKR